MRRWILLLVFPGCVFTPGKANNGKLDGGGGDPRADTPLANDGNPGTCYGTSMEDQTCFSAAPGGLITLSGAIDTMNFAMCSTSTTHLPTAKACVVAGASITVSGMVHVTGDRPLILVATNAIAISTSSVLDVSSKTLMNKPGTASDLNCAAAGDGAGTAGGAGGSFAGRGGSGGNDQQNTGATSASIIDPTMLRGGCPGGSGGNGGAGGRGGGVVALIAPTIVISGVINASGGGGNAPTGGGSDKGGGGGGAGGMIGLDATTISGTGAVMANGGGGGGSTVSSAGSAMNGSDPITAMPTTAAGGGSGPAATGGDGSAGGTLMGSPGGSNSSAGGGAGGGGGAGVIRFYKGSFGGTSSP